MGVFEGCLAECRFWLWCLGGEDVVECVANVVIKLRVSGL